jgi:hypothetical protein
MVVEIFPLRTRVTSMSFAYSVTLALAGGTAPLVSTWLIERLGQPTAPAFYIMAYGSPGWRSCCRCAKRTTANSTTEVGGMRCEDRVDELP